MNGFLGREVNFHRDVGDGPEYSTISLGLDARYAWAGSLDGLTLFDVRDGMAWQFFDADGYYVTQAVAQADVFYGRAPPGVRTTELLRAARS